MKKKVTFIFYSLALFTLIGSVIIYLLFKETSHNIEQNNLHSNIEYIDNITSNISKLIQNSTKNNIYKTLSENKVLRTNLEKSLTLFIAKRYRYVYVVDKENPNSDDFRFLLDGSKNNKAEFSEDYTPLNIAKWQEVYSTKHSLYFQNNDIKSLWMTYLKPIVVDNKVQAIIAIDFSLSDYNVIVTSLQNLNSSFMSVIIFSTFIFFIILLFLFIDKKRMKKLEEQSQKIHNFNKTLQAKIDEEVSKNRQKDQQLIQQSRLAQMGEMISMIAHQWRQPLSAINSTAIAINFKAQLNKLDQVELIEMSNKISSFSQHLSTTIDDFRDFFKPNKEKQKVTYTEIIQDVLNIVETALKNKNITIIKEMNSDIIFNTYPNELKQVLLNLIKNAEDILIENKIQNPTIIIKTEENDLTLSDNGGGIPTEIIDKIFDPYFSTKTQKNGTGLGLYMSKTIIEDHCEGKLSVTNSEKGATFKISLNNN